MTPDGLPALTIYVSETSQRPRAMAMAGMLRFPIAFLPPPPPGPHTLLYRPFALTPSLPSFLPTSSLPVLPFLRGFTGEDSRSEALC